MDILPAYKAHLETYPNSLLTRFFGLHRIMVTHESAAGMFRGYKNWWFIVMANVCYTSLGMHECYDLKGSTYNRRVCKKGQKIEHDKMYKDEDFLDRLQCDGPLGLDLDTRNKLVWQHGVDTEFLQSVGIMDYSILLHIHDTAKARAGDLGFGATTKVANPRSIFTVVLAAAKFKANRNECDSDKDDDNRSQEGKLEKRRALGEAFTSCDGYELYYLGIIDILTTYNFGRATQDFLLQSLSAVTNQKSEHSCVEPKRYRNRQMQFFRAALGYKSMSLDRA